jgi:hypothetical protein
MQAGEERSERCHLDFWPQKHQDISGSCLGKTLFAHRRASARGRKTRPHKICPAIAHRILLFNITTSHFRRTHRGSLLHRRRYALLRDISCRTHATHFGSLAIPSLHCCRTSSRERAVALLWASEDFTRGHHRRSSTSAHCGNTLPWLVDISGHVPSRGASGQRISLWRIFSRAASVGF